MANVLLYIALGLQLLNPQPLSLNPQDSLGESRFGNLIKPADKHGVYVVKIEGKKRPSTIFPDHLSDRQIDQSIYEALDNANKSGIIEDNYFQGKTSFGFEVGGYFDKSRNTITTAYPIHVTDLQ